MKISHLVSLSFVAGIVGLGLFAGNALSGQPRPSGAAAAAPAAGNGPVVVAIDLSKVLKEHRGFKAKMDAMAVEVKAAEVELNTLRDAIAKQEEVLKTPTSTSPKPGTDAYKQLESEIIQRKSVFNANASVKKKDLMEKETKIYYTVYKEIADEVKAFADYYKISMVLRYNSDAVDVPPGTQPGREEVAKLMSKPIIYLGPNLDITDQILTSINRRYPETANAQPAGGFMPKKTN